MEHSPNISPQTANAATTRHQMPRLVCRETAHGPSIAANMALMDGNHVRASSELDPAVANPNPSYTKLFTSSESKPTVTSTKHEEHQDQTQISIFSSANDRHIYSSNPYVKDSYRQQNEARVRDVHAQLTSNDWIARMTIRVEAGASQKTQLLYCRINLIRHQEQMLDQNSRRQNGLQHPTGSLNPITRWLVRRDGFLRTSLFPLETRNIHWKGFCMPQQFH